MSVTVLWEAHFGPDNAAQGRAVMNRIWHDMRRFAGYLDHDLILDLDDSGHIAVISHWMSREAADRVRDEYRQSANAVEADRLSTQPRRRIVGITVER